MAKTFLFRHKFRMISALAFLTVIFLMTNFADNRKNTDEAILNQAASGLDKSIPEDCKNLFDSLDRVKQWKKSRLSSVGNSISTFFLGVSKIDECDSFNQFPVHNDPCYKTKYFIQLPGYTIKDEASFFIDKGNYYVGYEIWDSIYGANKQVGVRYAPGFSNEGGALLIPISKKAYDILHVVVVILLIAFIVACFFLFIVLPYAILVSIAKGTPFTKSNIKRLYIVGWALIGVVLLSSLVPLIIELFLKNRPPEIYFPFLLSLTDMRPVLIAGIVTLMLASAFKRGYQLQQEQNLTI